MDNLLKLLKITSKRLKQNFFRNIIIIIFVMTAVFFMNISLSTLRHCIYQNTLAHSSGLYDSYMYAGLPSKQAYYNNNGTDMFQKADEYIRLSLSKAKKEGRINDYFPIDESLVSLKGISDTQVRIFSADYDLLKNLSFPVAKGKWFDKYPYSAEGDDPVPIVVGYNLKSTYHVGQITSIGSSDENYIVIGILKLNTLFLESGAGGSGIDLNSVTQPADNMIIIAKESEYAHHSSFIIELPDENQEDSEKTVLNEISDVTGTFSFQYLADKAYRDNIFGIQMHITMSILTLLICITGMECTNLLSFVREKRKLSVYFLCGMNKSAGILTSLLEGMLKLYIPAAVGYNIFILYCRRNAFNGLYVDFINIILTEVVITLIFIGTLVKTLRVAEKNNALTILQS